MPKGKPWTKEQELKLKELIDRGVTLKIIAAELGKTEASIRMKARRLGLEVVEKTPRQFSTTSLKLPKELPSVEDALKILAGALKAAAEPGLDKVEVQRLQVVATLARTYKDILADYLNYREVEKKLVELDAKYAKRAEEKA
jgi:transcriptional regulator